MTETEADKIAEIVASADGYCSGCARNGWADLTKEFPEIDWRKRFKDIALRENLYWAKEVEKWIGY